MLFDLQLRRGGDVMILTAKNFSFSAQRVKLNNKLQYTSIHSPQEYVYLLFSHILFIAS